MYILLIKLIVKLIILINKIKKAFLQLIIIAEKLISKELFILYLDFIFDIHLLLINGKQVRN